MFKEVWSVGTWIQSVFFNNNILESLCLRFCPALLEITVTLIEATGVSLQVNYKLVQTCSSDTKLYLEPDSMKFNSGHIVVMCIISTVF